MMRRPILLALSLVLAGVASRLHSAEVLSPLLPVDVRIPTTPVAFASNGRANVVYEIHVQSYRSGDLDWDRLDVLSEGAVLASFSGAELEAMITRPGQGAAEPRHLAAGTSAVAFVWVQTAATPKVISHRLTFTIPNATSGPRVLDTAGVAVDASPIVIGPPARGNRWVARWNDGASFHRRGLMTFEGLATIPQRFAIDWNHVGDDGREWHGDGAKNTDYAVYGQEVIAVADGVVENVADGIPENEPGTVNPKVTITVDTAAGNCVQLKLREGVFALYAHLQPGSLRVKPGSRVRRGQVLGLAGNSGNTTGPHLHFHLSTLPGLRGEGLPFVIDRFLFLGVESEEQATTGVWTAPASARPRTREWPEAHSVVSFPGT
jgi:peptidase M23-like protein